MWRGIGGSRGGREGRTPPPGRPNSFDFMQFSGKFGVFTPPLEGSRPPSGKSWIRHWEAFIPIPWHHQWRIQDFPEGAPIPKVGVLTYYFANFCRKTAWKLKNLDPKGPHLRYSPPGFANFFRECQLLCNYIKILPLRTVNTLCLFTRICEGLSFSLIDIMIFASWRFSHDEISHQQLPFWYYKVITNVSQWVK